MLTRFDELLGQREWLLADGAIGSNLFAQGLEPGVAPECWNRDHPERITNLHQSFVNAGADIILTNSFGANRRRLELLGENDVLGLNQTAARLARTATQSSKRPVLVAGSMGPSGALLEPYGDLSSDEARSLFAEQANALADGGVDCLWIETMAAGEELNAAVAGAVATGLPLICTFSFDNRSHTMMGLNPEAAVTVIESLAVPPVAAGANCGYDAADTVAVVATMHQHLGNMPLVAKGNCGQPRYHGGKFEYGKSTAYMACYAQLARDAGARIIGGCCGTTAKHLYAMHQALQNYRPTAFSSYRAQRLLQKKSID